MSKATRSSPPRMCFSVVDIRDFPEPCSVVNMNFLLNDKEKILMTAYVIPDGNAIYDTIAKKKLFIKWFNQQPARIQGKLLTILPELSGRWKVKVKKGVLEEVAMGYL